MTLQQFSGLTGSTDWTSEIVDLGQGSRCSVACSPATLNGSSICLETCSSPPALFNTGTLVPRTIVVDASDWTHLPSRASTYEPPRLNPGQPGGGAPMRASAPRPACNVRGDLEPSPPVAVGTLDALTLARFVVGQDALSCCAP